jgi:hypothetical protein
MCDALFEVRRTFVHCECASGRREGMADEKLQGVFDHLKPILQQHEAGATVTADTPTAYSLDSKRAGPNGKPLFFGAVQVKKNYVSFHLMPVYMFPDLLDGISPALQKRMQGKSCFNFKTLEPALFDELAQLTGRSVARMSQE